MLDKIEEAIEDIRAGKMIIVVDDEDRENEGDFVMAADKVTPEAINFMAKYGRGMICTPITEQTAKRLNLQPMVNKNTASLETAFTITVDAAKGISTGISASDRARTIALMADEKSEVDDFVRPGHIFPLIAKDGGVLKRDGHTEASIDLARLAGSKPAGVICEITNDDGTMARLPELREMADEHGLKLISIADLIKYRRQTEINVRRDETIKLPTQTGGFDLHTYKDLVTDEVYMVLTSGDFTNSPIVRLHSQCMTGDLFGSKRCDCGEQLTRSQEIIAKNGGVLIYHPQEGRGIGLLNKVRAYKLQEEGYDTIEANKRLGFHADMRDYSACAQILKSLGVREIKLLTNNPDKVESLETYGIEVSARLPIEIEPNKNNEYYLSTKKSKMGHLFSDNVIQLH
jgi:3,4-dihydroxy 2-butanone 4-phosphate synthase/GTP cyclohydrolase II